MRVNDEQGKVGVTVVCQGEYCLILNHTHAYNPIGSQYSGPSGQ